MIEKFLLRLRQRDEVSAEEEATLRSILKSTLAVPARRCVIRQGETLDRSILLIDGIMARHNDMRDGQRQISALHLAGEFCDLQGFSLKYLDHDVSTMTDCTISWAPHDDIRRITEDHPHLTRLLWFSTNLDAAIHRVWTVSLGRRDAASRLAHLICELQVRLGVVGLADQHGYDLPLTQVDLAECLGLTSVHVNRVLRDLRERGLLIFKSGHVHIGDLAGLRRVGEFKPDYLYLDKMPL